MSKKLSRDELLDEAITKAKVEAKKTGDWQLVEWLRAARGSEESARWFTLKLRDVRDENKQLREIVTRMARALGVGTEWCHRECYAEFRCTDGCEIADALVELGIAEVVE